MRDGSLNITRPDPAAVDPAFYLHERYRTPAARRKTLNLYYTLKPLLPRRLQIALRRLYARRVRPSFPAWPIEPLLVEHEHERLRRTLVERSLSRLPLVGYWPDGHRFAVVVTHDVESSAGVERVEAMLEVERRHGIVSCWNFVAEWYPIPPTAFAVVRAAGGEIGLHAIKHDGRLFADRASFERELPAIRRYMQEWDAVGFRSPALHRNAEWMAELDCLYDSSFPDTDPYEPEPGGCCSILPFFLGSLVELPVTMVQDHTLWEILREPRIDLWQRKAEWLIENHGLINVIVHPDYVNTPQRLELYEQLLAFLQEQVEKRRGWHALPRDVAAWWRARASLRVEGEGEGAQIVDGGAPAQWAQRARLAWASQSDSTITIDP
jgi:hypothetical protein